MSEKKESFFSSLFKGKKDNQTNEEKVILQNMLDKKDRIISQLQEKLNFEAEKRKKSEVFLKQSDIIQRNLENKDKKNRELKALLEVSEERFQYTDSERALVLERYNNLMKTFNETKEENLALKDIHTSLKNELINLNTLKEQESQSEVIGDTFLSRDEVEEMQEDILSLRTLCGEQRNTIDRLIEENSALTREDSKNTSLIQDLEERLENSIPVKNPKPSYRLPLKRFFTSSKYSSVLDILERSGYSFIDEIDTKNIHNTIDGVKNADLAVTAINNFNMGRYSWEIKTYIFKGPKLSKIFSRQRKLLGYFTENYMEFLVDIEDFDLNTLVDFGFSRTQVKTFQEKLKEYKNLKIPN